MRRVLFLALAALVVGASIASATPAQPAAATPCAPTFHENVVWGADNADDLSVFVAETSVDTAAFVPLWNMCFPTAPTVTITSNPQNAVVDVDADGDGSGITVTPPSAFSGLLTVELTIAYGADSRDYSLYVYVGTPAASFPSVDGHPRAGTVGVPISYDFTGLSTPDGTTMTGRVLDPSPAFTATFDASAPSLTVTPQQNIAGPVAVQLRVGNGIQTRDYRFVVWIGVPVPTTVIWGPQPKPVEIDERGTGYFTLTNYVPWGTECEIKVETEPDANIAAEPPRLDGLPSDIGIRVIDDFTGKLTVHYFLSCRVDGVVSSRDFLMVLYVGVPMPVEELAETGTEPVAVLPFGIGALAAGALALVVGRRRRIRNLAM